ncbi:hypothetical protein, partial [Kosmotoga sp. DU53]|uniref:hypothetical protein n=1 Tax=Kosmotoga sp. DU53 TaxID=1310160 RepID=UPI001F1FF949
MSRGRIASKKIYSKRERCVKNKSTQKRGIIFSNTREGRREDEEVRYEKCGGRLFKKVQESSQKGKIR